MNGKRQAGFGFLVCAGFAVSFHNLSRQPAHAQDLPAIKTLNPLGSFTIPKNSALRVRAVKSSGASIWFLLTGPNYTEAVRTDSTGLKQMSFALPSPMSGGINSTCASEAGRFAVVHFKGEIDVFSSIGAITETFDAAKGRSDRVFDGEALYGINSTTVSPLEGSADKSFTSQAPSGFTPGHLFFTRDHHLAVVDTTEASLNVLDLANGEWHKTPLVAPEIQSFTRPANILSYELPILTVVAVDATSGDFYTGVNEYSFVKGATVLKCDERGQLIGRLRCVIPNSPEWITGTNKDGHFSGSAIAVADGKLLWISTPQKQVVYFSLN